MNISKILTFLFVLAVASTPVDAMKRRRPDDMSGQGDQGKPSAQKKAKTSNEQKTQKQEEKTDKQHPALTPDPSGTPWLSFVPDDIRNLIFTQFLSQDDLLVACQTCRKLYTQSLTSIIEQTQIRDNDSNQIIISKLNYLARLIRHIALTEKEHLKNPTNELYKYAFSVAKFYALNDHLQVCEVALKLLKALIKQDYQPAFQDATNLASMLIAFEDLKLHAITLFELLCSHHFKNAVATILELLDAHKLNEVTALKLLTTLVKNGYAIERGVRVGREKAAGLENFHISSGTGEVINLNHIAQMFRILELFEALISKDELLEEAKSVTFKCLKSSTLMYVKDAAMKVLKALIAKGHQPTIKQTIVYANEYANNVKRGCCNFNEFKHTLNLFMILINNGHAYDEAAEVAGISLIFTNVNRELRKLGIKIFKILFEKKCNSAVTIATDFVNSCFKWNNIEDPEMEGLLALSNTLIDAGYGFEQGLKIASKNIRCNIDKPKKVFIAVYTIFKKLIEKKYQPALKTAIEIVLSALKSNNINPIHLKLFEYLVKQGYLLNEATQAAQQFIEKGLELYNTLTLLLDALVRQGHQPAVTIAEQVIKLCKDKIECCLQQLILQEALEDFKKRDEENEKIKKDKK